MKKNRSITARVSSQDILILEEISDKYDITVSSVIRACIAPILEDEFMKKIKINLSKGLNINVAMREARLDFAR